MPLQYNYYVDQGNYTQVPSNRAYSYQSSSAPRETKTENVQRYPNVYKIFNNRRGYGETNSGAADNVSQQAPMRSQRHVSKKGVPHKVRFADQEEEIGQKKKEADVVLEEKNIDAAADGFINWKRRSLQMCRTFKDE